MDKIVCVGKNYLEHARELGDAVPEKPVLFLKPPSVMLPVESGEAEVPLPRGRGSVHYETEIVLRLAASGAIEAVTLGLDLTLRDAQGVLKKAGLPWEISKVFPCSAVVGPWIPVAEFPEWREEEFTFSLEGTVRQKASAREMRLTPEECVAAAAEHFPLCDGDLMFTGTPAGVELLRPGQAAELAWGERLQVRVRFV